MSERGVAGRKSDADLLRLARAIAARDQALVSSLLKAVPSLATARFSAGATRAASSDWFLAPIGHHVYAGATALHVAAAAGWVELVAQLLAAGADVGARDRRGTQPLHLAADGRADGSRNRSARALTIRLLVEHGADVNARDANGSTPLHRAARTRSATAVAALIAAGADPALPNRFGASAATVAGRSSGASGSGTATSHAERAAILDLLRERQ